jgi:hypothetical protein
MFQKLYDQQHALIDTIGIVNVSADSRHIFVYALDIYESLTGLKN